MQRKRFIEKVRVDVSFDETDYDLVYLSMYAALFMLGVWLLRRL